MGNVKWGRVVLWSILGLVIIVVVPILYVTVRMFILGFQMGGNPGLEAQKALSSGTPIMVVQFLGVALAGFLGGRGTARKAEDSYVLNGLLAGVGIAILFMVYGLVTGGGFSLLLLALAALAIAAGALGGWVGGRAAEAEAYD